MSALLHETKSINNVGPNKFVISLENHSGSNQIKQAFPQSGKIRQIWILCLTSFQAEG